MQPALEGIYEQRIYCQCLKAGLEKAVNSKKNYISSQKLSQKTVSKPVNFATFIVCQFR